MMDQEVSQINFLRMKDVQKRTGLPRSSIYAEIKKNNFPSPVNLGIRRIGWIESEIDEWVQKIVKESRML